MPTPHHRTRSWSLAVAPPTVFVVGLCIVLGSGQGRPARAAAPSPVQRLIRAFSHVTRVEIDTRTVSGEGGSRPIRVESITIAVREGDRFDMLSTSSPSSRFAPGQVASQELYTASAFCFEAGIHGQVHCQRPRSAETSSDAVGGYGGLSSGLALTPVPPRTVGGQVCDGYRFTTLPPVARRGPSVSLKGQAYDVDAIYVARTTGLMCLTTIEPHIYGYSDNGVFVRTDLVWSHYNDPRLSVPRHLTP